VVARADATVRIELGIPTALAVTIHNPVSQTIADPGNAGAIPVTNGGHVAIVTAGAETRTLAAPSAAGQELLVYMKTDGGDCVITVATGTAQTTATSQDTRCLGSRRSRSPTARQGGSAYTVSRRL
jgi:hypothetical protein